MSDSQKLPTRPMPDVVLPTAMEDLRLCIEVSRRRPEQPFHRQMTQAMEWLIYFYEEALDAGE